MFSPITMAASIIVPIAIAIPPKLIILDGILNNLIKRKVRTMAMTRENAVMSVAPICRKKSPRTTMVMITSWTRTP